MATSPVVVAPSSLRELLELDDASLAKVDLARMNLLCAEGLPGFSGIAIDTCVSEIDRWAKWVEAETARYFLRFLQSPAEFGNSIGDFRMLTLVTCLQRDFGIHYNPSRISTPADPESDDAFFSDSQDIFLHGLAGARRQGTCASMPVLYAAVARRLGYPVRLVTAKAHLFARWDGQGEHFNIEGTNRGYSSQPDAYYRNWPFPLSPAEVETEGYLQSLSPKEELAVFLEARGNVLRAHGRLAEARTAYLAAWQRMPARNQLAMLLSRLEPRTPAVLTPEQVAALENQRFQAMARRLADERVPEPQPGVIDSGATMQRHHAPAVPDPFSPPSRPAQPRPAYQSNPVHSP